MSVQYGNLYWCVGLPDGREVFAHADRVEFNSGTVVLITDREEGAFPSLAFNSECWTFVYAASVMDGSAVSVEHWQGQIAERPAEVPVTRRAPVEEVAVYVHRDQKGNPLYVGITKDPDVREKTHRSNSAWGAEIHSVTLEWYGSREEAKMVETQCIKLFRPKYNKAENPERYTP